MPSSDSSTSESQARGQVPRPASTDFPTLLRFQADQCAVNGSPLYATILAAAASDAEDGGPCFEVLRGHEKDPLGTALVLRFMGGVHRLALEGDAPDLAAFYPSAGGSLEAGDPWPAFREAVAAHVDLLRTRLADGVQTNEVGRAAALAPAFLTVAIETGHPLRVLEVGASAGLNMRWDQFRYEDGDESWGSDASPVRLAGRWSGTPRPWRDAPSSDGVVVERAGCDPKPIDAIGDEGRHKLRSFVWPDQVERLRILDAAIEVARSAPATIEQEEAVPWLGRRLAEPVEGAATVVYHSIVMQYMNKANRAAVAQAIADAGNRATPDAPVAWLRMEPGWVEGRADVTLTTWPGGRERLIALTGFHGMPVEWSGPNGLRR
jgi:hypothetical protein